MENEILQRTNEIKTLSSSYAMLLEISISQSLEGQCNLSRQESMKIKRALLGKLYRIDILIFVSEYLAEYENEFFTIQRAALKREDIRGTSVKLLVVGNERINKARLLPILRNMNLEMYVCFLEL